MANRSERCRVRVAALGIVLLVANPVWTTVADLQSGSDVALTAGRDATAAALAGVTAQLERLTQQHQQVKETVQQQHVAIVTLRRKMPASIPRVQTIQDQIANLQKELDALRAELQHIQENQPELKALIEAQQKDLQTTRELGREIGQLMTQKRGLEQRLAQFPTETPSAPVPSSGGEK